LVIEKRTVFVLGAGASHQYGFPLGRELRDRVCRIPDDAGKVQLFEDLGVTPDALRAFVDTLRFSAHTSVDAFLEERPEYITVGKLAIACELVPCENPDLLFPPRAPSSHWYEDLAGAMEIGADRFPKNQLSILTFNYDRSFEHYFLTVLQTRRRIDEPEALKLLERIPIHHLHGDLGAFPETKPSGRAYEPTLAKQGLQTAASRIKIIHEASDGFPKEVISHLERAERIFFLGFGFHPANVQRLRIFEKPWDEERALRQQVVATSLGVPRAQWPKIHEGLFRGALDPRWFACGPDQLFRDFVPLE
jgi:hypothetical protein